MPASSDTPPELIPPDSTDEPDEAGQLTEEDIFRMKKLTDNQLRANLTDPSIVSIADSSSNFDERVVEEYDELEEAESGGQEKTESEHESRVCDGFMFDRRRAVNVKLPDTVDVLKNPFDTVLDVGEDFLAAWKESTLYLVGTAHFSKESQDDVIQTIHAVKPDIVMVELCASRLAILSYDEVTLLREAKDLNSAKIIQTIKQSGVVQGLLHVMLLSMSAHITRELSMAPGGEFRAAHRAANEIQNCRLILGDRPIQITLQRALGSLSIFQKLKFFYHILISHNSKITQEDVERCKQKDLLEQLLAEMAGDFPKLSQIFVDERDAYMTHALHRLLTDQTIKKWRAHLNAMATWQPLRIVAVVGIGHTPGIKKKCSFRSVERRFSWGKQINIAPLIEIPKPSLSSKIVGATKLEAQPPNANAPSTSRAFIRQPDIQEARVRSRQRNKEFESLLQSRPAQPQHDPNESNTFSERDWYDSLIIKPISLVAMLKRRELGDIAPGTHSLRAARDFYRVVPLRITSNMGYNPTLKIPMGWSPDGRFLVFFNRSLTSIIIHKYMGVESGIGFQSPQAFQAILPVHKELTLEGALHINATFMKEFIMFTEDDKHVLLCAVAENPAPATHREMFRTNGPNHPVISQSRYSFAGYCTDTYVSDNDKIQLGQGSSIRGNIFAYLSYQQQSVVILKISSDGKFEHYRTIGSAIYEDEELEFRTPIGLHLHDTTFVSGLRQLIMSQIYRQCDHSEGNMKMYRFHRVFNAFRSLQVTRACLVDQRTIALRVADDLNVNCNPHLPFFTIIYDFVASKVVKIFDVFTKIDDKYFDFYQELSEELTSNVLHRSRYPNGPGNCIPTTHIYKIMRTTSSDPAETSNSNIDIMRRLIRTTPWGVAVLSQESPYLDQELFFLECEVFHALLRSRLIKQSIIWRAPQPNGQLKTLFCFTPSTSEAHGNSGRTQSILFHPYDPFAVFVDRSDPDLPLAMLMPMSCDDFLLTRFPENPQQHFRNGTIFYGNFCAHCLMSVAFSSSKQYCRLQMLLVKHHLRFSSSSSPFSPSPMLYELPAFIESYYPQHFKCRDLHRLPQSALVLSSREARAKLVLLGTNHTSSRSQREVSEALAATNPDAVVLELCRQRTAILSHSVAQRDFKAFQKSSIAKSVANQILHRRKHDGGEFWTAFKICDANQTPIILGDRLAEISRQRVLANLDSHEAFRWSSEIQLNAALFEMPPATYTAELLNLDYVGRLNIEEHAPDNELDFLPKTELELSTTAEILREQDAAVLLKPYPHIIDQWTQPSGATIVTNTILRRGQEKEDIQMARNRFAAATAELVFHHAYAFSRRPSTFSDSNVIMQANTKIPKFLDSLIKDKNVDLDTLLFKAYRRVSAQDEGDGEDQKHVPILKVQNGDVLFATLKVPMWITCAVYPEDTSNQVYLRLEEAIRRAVANVTYVMLRGDRKFYTMHPVDVRCFRPHNYKRILTIVTGQWPEKDNDKAAGKITTVRGAYDYYHYMQQNIDDSGWGCAYRSLQSIWSWYVLNGFSDRPIPVHREIQEALVRIEGEDLRGKKFVGSSRWIGSFEIGYVLGDAMGIDCAYIAQFADISEKARELQRHFEDVGSPVMIGGNQLAHTILGVDFDDDNGECRFLVLDPHYIGPDDINVVTSKGWCAWKMPNFWKQGLDYAGQPIVYNIVKPQLPAQKV